MNSARKLGVTVAVTPFLLILLAAIPAGGVESPTLFNVRNFGAVGNGVVLDTENVNKAIAACAAAGGGTVYFPAGTYLSGTIRLKNNLTLWLDAGAILLGTKDLAHYQTAVEGDERYEALILAKGVHNVAVIGSGTIDGNHVFNPRGEERIRGPHAVFFYDSENITVRDVSIKDAGNYSLILRSCREVTVDGITVHGGWDGINMHDVRNAAISNCRLFTGDDSLAGRYWENVTVSHCILNSGANAIRVGGHNVLFTDSSIYGPAESEHLTSLRHHSEAGFQILPNSANAKNKYVALGPVDNMVLSNITMVNVATPFYVASSSDAAYSVNNLGVGRITVNNLTVRGAGKTPLYISAAPENPAKSIILNNLRMTFAGGASETQSQGQGFSPFSILQAYAVYARNVQRLELHDVRVGFEEADLRPALFGENIGTLELDRFQPERAAAGTPAIQGSGIGHLIVDGKEPAAAQWRVSSLELPAGAVVAGEPFQIRGRLENAGREGFGELPLRLGKQSVLRNVWLEAGEKAQVTFVNLRYAAPAEIPGEIPGEIEVRAGDLTRKLHVLPKPQSGAVSAPYQIFHNVPGEFNQLGENSFYLRSGGDYPVMQYGDQYGAVYLRRALPQDATVVVKVENPDLRTNWQGRAGIMVRNDISKPGQSAGYLVLGSSPAAGSYLEWDSDASTLLGAHTEFEGYTLWPHWLKLERHGSKFTGYASADGIEWARIGAADLPSANDALDVGLFTFRSSARFEKLTIQK